MKPRINFITLAVRNLQKSLDFYKNGFGFPTSGIQEGNENHVLFDLENGFGLVLYLRDDFLELTANPKQKELSAGFILSCVAESKKEVDEILDRAIRNGAASIGKPNHESWGYSATLTDPDGHHWEITYMIK